MKLMLMGKRFFIRKITFPRINLLVTHVQAVHSVPDRPFLKPRPFFRTRANQIVHSPSICHSVFYGNSPMCLPTQGTVQKRSLAFKLY